MYRRYITYALEKFRTYGANKLVVNYSTDLLLLRSMVRFDKRKL